MPKVIVQFGGEEWSVDLREGVNVAGRSPQAAIPIRDASMSREHCEIVLEGGVATVVDRGSMNGTLVNGSKMDRKVLAPGDKIQIGKASLYFEEKSKPAAPAPKAAAAAAPAHVAGIDDFSVWRKEGGSLVAIVIAVIVLLVCGAGAVFLFKSVGGNTVVATDPGNLIGVTGRFEPGPDSSVVGWTVRPGLSSKIQVAVGTAKQGKTSLQLDKSGSPQDFLAEVLNQEILPVPSTGGIEMSAWAMSEGSSLSPALKVTWLATRKGPVLLEVMSEPSPGSSNWSQLTQAFGAPSGAQYVQVSLVALGRGGRVLFDEVRVREASGGSPARPVSVGSFSVAGSPVGVLSVTQQDTKRIINNIQLFLASDKEGVSTQGAASGGKLEADAGKVTAAGRMANPVDLRPVDYDIEARGGKDSVLLGYRLRGDSLKQLDRVGIVFLLPNAELKGDYSKEVPKLWFRTTGVGDFILDLTDGLMKATADWVPEARRVMLNLPVPKGATELSFSFILKVGGGGATDPMQAAEKAIAEGRMSDAYEIYKEVYGETRDEAKRDQLQKRMKDLDEKEASDWHAVQGLQFMAELLSLKPNYDGALQRLGEYEKRWPARRVEAAKATRAQLTTDMATAADDRDTVRANTLLTRAEQMLQEGRKTLARELCETVKRHYSQTTAAARAAELLKKIGSD